MPIGSLGRQLQDAVAQAMDGTPVLGLSACLIPAGEPAIEHVVHHGVRNVDSGVPVDDHTVFAIGSVSKLFTAFVIHQLVAERALELDTVVADLLPETAASLQYPEAITVSHLLSHTSGVPDLFYDAPDASAVVRDLRDLTVPRSPIGIFSYSNTNYVILGMLIERLTGQNWTTRITERLYGPLGLDDPLTSSPEHVAEDHLSPRAPDQFVVGDMWPRVGAAFEAAGSTLLATARELGQLVLACLTGRTPEGAELLPEQLAHAATRQVTAVPGYGNMESGWALGWSIEQGSPATNARRLVGHRGGTAASVHADPDDHTVLVTLGNSPLGGRAGRHIAQQVLGSPNDRPETRSSGIATTCPPEDRDKLPGTYRSATFPVTVDRHGDGLRVTNPLGGDPISLRHISGRSYVADFGVMLSNVDFLGPADEPAESVHLLLRNLPRGGA